MLHKQVRINECGRIYRTRQAASLLIDVKKGNCKFETGLFSCQGVSQYSRALVDPEHLGREPREGLQPGGGVLCVLATSPTLHVGTLGLLCRQGAHAPAAATGRASAAVRARIRKGPISRLF